MFLVAFAIAVYILSLNLSTAAVIVISPQNGTNHSGTVLYNVTFVNGTDLFIIGTSTTQINASFYAVSGATSTLLGNSSTCAVSSGTTFACWTRIAVTSSINGFFNITAQIFNNTGAARNSSVNTTSIYLDNVNPLVSESNFSSPLRGSNNSGALTLNVSVFDSTIGIGAVLFNITNSTGVQNSSLTATREGSTNYYTVQINTTSYPDGLYNITVYANDSLNNLNNTARVYSVIFDNTDPNTSPSCSPSSISVGDSFPCSCSASDATSGVSSSSGSSTSPDGTSTPVNSGTFTYTCTANDYSGNSASSSVQYTVSDTGGSSGSAGSSSSTTSTGWVATYPISSASLIEGITRDLAAKRRLEIEVNGEKHHLGVVSLSTTSALISVSSTPVEKNMNIGQSEKFELTDDNYYDLLVTLDSISGNQAKVTVKTINEEIISVPNVPVNEPTQNEELIEGKKSNMIWWIIGIVLVLVVAGIIFYTRKNHRK